MSTEKTIGDALIFGVTQLNKFSDSPKQDIEVLLCEVLDCSRTKLFTAPDDQMLDVEYQRFCELVAQRKTGKPVSYIIGHQDFWSLSLEVNESTLIPRPETELLVEQVLSLSLPECSKVLDLGTGTGAIALAVAKEKPHWHVTGSDRIPLAVELAERNRNRNGIANTTFLESCWFEAFQKQHFDVILSNPPYVESNSEYLKKGDLRFEPMSALASGGNGLDDIRIIVSQSPRFLTKGGWLLLEHGFNQGAAIRALFEAACFQQVSTIKDYADLDRITLGCLV